MIKNIRSIQLANALLIICLVVGVAVNVIFPINFGLSGMVIVLVMIGLMLAKPIKIKLKEISENNMQKMIIIGLGLIVLIQILLLFYFQVSVYHDPFRVLYQAELLSKGQNSWVDTTYFWRYPNNASITILLSWWLKLTSLVHLTTNFSINLLSMIFLDTLIFMTIKLVWKIGKSVPGTLLVLLFFLITPFAYSYNLHVFYSDVPSMFALLFIFRVVMGWGQFSSVKRIVNGIALVITVTLGQIIKPNLIVLMVATIIFIVYLWRFKKLVFKKLWMPLVMIILGFMLALPTQSLIEQSANFERNNTYELPIESWIWMGMNSGTKGTYSSADVAQLVKLKDQVARKKYVEQKITQRVKKLGIIGLLKQWIEKLGELLNVSGVADSYSGGFVNAPSWYLRYAAIINNISAILERSAWILLFMFTIKRSWAFGSKRSMFTDDRWLLIELTVLGYIGFHVLLWEVESRYGKVLLPLLLILNVLPIKKSIQPVGAKVFNGLTLLMGSILAVLFVTNVNFPKKISLQPQIVAAQRSQLSGQYGAKPIAIKAGHELQQNVLVNHQASTLLLSLPKGSKLTGVLINNNDGQEYKLKKIGNSFGIKTTMKAGMYTLKLSNSTSKKQEIWMISTIEYKLTNYPLIIDGQLNRYGALIYQFIE